MSNIQKSESGPSKSWEWLWTEGIF